MTTLQKSLIGIFVFFGICFVFIWRAGQVTGDANLVWYSVVPPLLAVTLAILTTRLILSLGIAVGLGLVLGWTRQDWTPSGFLAEVVWFAREVTIKNGSDIDFFNIWVIVFVFLIMATISVVVASGGIAGVVTWLSRFAKGPRSTQVITAVMGIVIFIGDYSNAMLVGPTMRPLTDYHRVSREKLAYIVDSTSAPIAGLAFVSTWIGYEIGLFNDVAISIGLERDGYSMFFDAPRLPVLLHPNDYFCHRQRHQWERLRADAEGREAGAGDRSRCRARCPIPQRYDSVQTGAERCHTAVFSGAAVANTFFLAARRVLGRWRRDRFAFLPHRVARGTFKCR